MTSAPMTTASTPGNDDVYQDKSFKLFVPYVHDKTTTAKVFAVFANLQFGRLGRDGDGEAIEFLPRTDSKGRPYKSVIVHFKHLFSRGANGAENKRIFEHLEANRDNFITVEHMPAKTLDDGTELPARTWQPRLDRPRVASGAGGGGSRRPNIALGKQERRKAKMIATDEDWEDLEHADGRTADEVTEAVNVADTTEEKAESDNGEAEEITDEEYAARILSGAQ
jgi:hypothetical protein